MRVHTASNPGGGKRTEPALFTTTQTTIPILTQIMAGFSLAAIAIAASAASSISIPCLPFELTTKGVSLALIGLSALLFLFATEACIKSQAWDYFVLSEDRRKFIDLSDTEDYIDKCLTERDSWHRIAVWSYRLGIISIMLGTAFLFWPLSKATSVIIGFYLPISLVLLIVVNRRQNQLLGGAVSSD
jgi:hypothetical protein